MKLKKLSVKNFLSYGNERQEIDFTRSQITYIVGPNNSGKSNLIRILNFVAEVTLMDPQSKAPPSFPYEMFLQQSKRNVEIVVDLEMSDKERQVIKDFILCTFIRQIYGFNDPRTRIMKQILDKYKDGFFDIIGNDISIVIKSNINNHIRPIKHFVKLYLQNKQFYLFENRINNIDSIFNIEPNFEIQHAIPFYDVLISDYENRYLGGNHIPDNPKNELDASYILPNIASLLESELSSKAPFPGIINRVDMPVFVVSGYPTESEYTLLFEQTNTSLKNYGFKDNEHVSLSTLIYAIFSTSLIWVPDIHSKIPNYEEITIKNDISTTSKMPAKMDTEKLLNRLFNMSTSNKLSDYNRFKKVRSDFQEFTGMDFRFVINDDIDKNVKVMALEMMNGDSSWPITYSSAGLIEILTLLTSIAESKDKILLLDEPAQNMHPSFQNRFLNTLLKSLEEYGGQTIIVTHSPFMLSKAKIGDIWRTNRLNEYTHIISVEDELKKVEKKGEKLLQKVGVELDKADIRSLLFSRGGLFVEGLSDKFVVEVLESKLMQKEKGMGLYDNEWTIVSMNAKGNTEKYLKFAETLGLGYAFLLDRDAEEDVKKILQKRGVQNLKEKDLQDNGFFLLPDTLDTLLGLESKKDKPLKALSKVQEMKVEEIPSELMKFFEFVKTRIYKDPKKVKIMLIIRKYRNSYKNSLANTFRNKLVRHSSLI